MKQASANGDRPLNSDRPFAADDWTLVPQFGGEDPESDLTLIDLLARDEDREVDMKEAPKTLRARCSQPTLIGLAHLLSDTEGPSVAKIYRVATKLGLQLIRKEKQYISLQGILRGRLEDLRTEYNADRNARLAHVTKLLPTDASNDRWSIRVYCWIPGALEEVSYRIGMSETYLAIFCLLYAFATVPNLGAYMPIITQDIERFRREILEERLNTLSRIVSRAS